MPEAVGKCLVALGVDELTHGKLVHHGARSKLPVTGVRGVPYCLAEVPVLAEPPRRAQVQVLHAAGVVAPQLQPEDGREQ